MCLNILLKNTGSNVISGRIMDYEVDSLGKFVPVPAGGELFNAENYSGTDPLPKAKYGHVVIDFVDKPYPSDGMNSEGLSVSITWLEETIYSPEDNRMEGKKYYPISHFVTYILAMCKDVVEVRKVMSDVYFYEITVDLYSWRPMMHVMANDRNGGSLVVEFINGVPVMYDFDVLTGSPPMDIHLKKLQEYKGIVERNPKLAGLRGIAQVLDDDYLDERFLLLCHLNQTRERANTVQKAVARCFRIFGRLELWDEEFFLRDGSRAKFIWSIVRDHKSLKIYYRSRYNQTIQMVDVNKLLASGRSDIYIKNGEWFTEVE